MGELMAKGGVDEYSFLEQFRRELRESIGAGAALAALGLAAGCGCNADPLPPVSSSTDAGSLTPQSALDPYPTNAIGCFGPLTESPLYGPQCCFDAHCYTPTAGAACIADLEDPALRQVLPFPLGSGTCGCSVEDEGRPVIDGPYAPNPTTATDAMACCYIMGSWGCTGRPFVVSGTQRIAPLACRGDWGLFA